MRREPVEERPARFERAQMAGRPCALWRTERPARYLLLWPVDGRELDAMEGRAERLWRMTGAPFLLCGFSVEDWDRELSPWEAPAIYGRTPFGGGAERTLAWVTSELLPALRDRYGPDAGCRVLIGGYSLAGLFALWCGYETDLFAGVAAASPSVWFDGWLDFAARRTMGAQAVYLSLGDREEKARNPRLAQVGDCVRRQKELLDGSGVPGTLVWEQGSHFQDADTRTVRGFAWLIERMSVGP